MARNIFSVPSVSGDHHCLNLCAQHMYLQARSGPCARTLRDGHPPLFVHGTDEPPRLLMQTRSFRELINLTLFRSLRTICLSNDGFDARRRRSASSGACLISMSREKVPPKRPPNIT